VSPRTKAPALSREVVADRAVALADAEGIEAVTIRRLATELGVTPMALYWHFRTKEELLAGLGDRVLDSLEVPPATDDWAGDLRAALVALVTAMRPHPQLAHLVAARMLQHPRGRDITELALHSLATAGFAPEPASYLAMHALRAAIALVTGDQVDDSGVSPQERDEQLRHKTAMIRSLSPAQYPQLVAHADAMTYCSDVELFFELGVEHYIAGVCGLAPNGDQRRASRTGAHGARR
jgi:TetR/AcrR family transcriptional regulator, tetracycline repressor protein